MGDCLRYGDLLMFKLESAVEKDAVLYVEESMDMSSQADDLNTYHAYQLKCNTEVANDDNPQRYSKLFILRNIFL